MNTLAFTKNVTVTATSLALALLPTFALAQATGGGVNPNISNGANGGTAACNAIVNSASAGQANGTLAGVAVFLSGTPFRIAAFIGIVMAAVVLLLDQGHLPQVAQRVLQVVIIIVIVGVVVGFIFNPANNLAQC